MERCLRLAANGRGKTYPNPMVGSVIVYEDKIIGEGWHQKAGMPHAEVNAVNSVRDKTLLKKSIIYVSLEPCSHYGKTPPCADFIIASRIPEVVIGCVDPNTKVAAKGIKKLLDAGCRVRVGVLEKECREINTRFFTFQQKKRPYIILKWAQTLDGCIAPADQETGIPAWITNAYSKQLVHKWRTEEQAILVGTNTAVKDNPKLSSRLWKGNNPIRVVLDRTGRIPENSFLLDNNIPTIVLTEKTTEKPVKKNLFFENIDFDKNVVEQICEILYKRGIQSVIVEGGTQTLTTFISAGLWDEARVFTSNTTFQEGLQAPVFNAPVFKEEKIKHDKLTIYRNDQHDSI